MTEQSASHAEPSSFSEHSPPRAKGALLRILGVWFGVAVTIGATVSGGILRAPAEVAAQLPNVWLFIGIWIMGGLYAFVCSVSFAELSTMLPVSGGLFVYTRRALGDYAGFVVGWTDWVTSCGTVSASALLIAEISSGIIPVLSGQTLWVASILVVLFALLQWSGIRSGSMIQNLTSVVKTLALLAVALAALLLKKEAGLSFAATDAAILPAVSMPAFGLPLMFAAVLAFQTVIYMYDGYYSVVYFAEEVHNPRKDIPNSMFSSVAIAGGIYLLLNVAFVYVLPIPVLAHSTFVGGDVASKTFGQYGDVIIRLLIVMCELATINAFYLLGTRTLFAMSRGGLFSARVVQVNKGGTPTIALFLSMLIALAFVLSGTFEKALSILTFGIVANYALSFLSVFILRRRIASAPANDPIYEAYCYKAWGYPWTTGIALVVSVTFLVGSMLGDTENSVFALAAVAASYPAYLLTKRLVQSSNNT